MLRNLLLYFFNDFNSYAQSRVNSDLFYNLVFLKQIKLFYFLGYYAVKNKRDFKIFFTVNIKWNFHQN